MGMNTIRIRTRRYD